MDIFDTKSALLRFADISANTGSAPQQLLGKDIFMFRILQMLAQLYNPYRKTKCLFRYHLSALTFHFPFSTFN